jgi:hypothetical protein
MTLDEQEELACKQIDAMNEVIQELAKSCGLSGYNEIPSQYWHIQGADYVKADYKTHTLELYERASYWQDRDIYTGVDFELLKETDMNKLKLEFRREALPHFNQRRSYYRNQKLKELVRLQEIIDNLTGDIE